MAGGGAMINLTNSFEQRAPGLARVFILAWLVPFTVTMAGLVHYNYVWVGYVPVILLAPVAAWAAMHLAGRGPEPRREAIDYSTRYLRNTFYVLSLIAIVGHICLRLGYSQAGLDVGGDGVQELYLAAVEMGAEGSLSTGPLGTLGQLLRTAQPFAMICGVFLFWRQPGVLQKLTIAAVLAGSTLLAYLSSFSRGAMLLYLAALLVAAWSMPFPRRKLIMYGGALVIVGGAFFLASAKERIISLGFDEAQQTQLLQTLFDCETTPLSRAMVDVGDPELLGLALYLTSPVVEGTHVIMDNASPMMMGGFTFFPYVNPVKRLFGATTELDLSRLDRINMWYSAVGELYLDFGIYCFIVFPIVAFLMYCVAMRLRTAGLWGQIHYVITVVYFALFPLYSVFHSSGLVYAASLLLALRAAPRRRLLPLPKVFA
jgi:hypothetical protein